MKKKYLMLGLVAAICAVAGAYFAAHRSDDVSASDTAVARLLSQSLPDANGASQSLSQWKGRPLVVNFWATWCAPCVEEMSELSTLQQHVAKSGIQVIGIGIDSPENIAQFARQYRIAYPLYVGGMSATELARQLGSETGGLPFTVLIDAAGHVRQTYVGRVNTKALRQQLDLSEGKT